MITFLQLIFEFVVLHVLINTIKVFHVYFSLKRGGVIMNTDPYNCSSAKIALVSNEERRLICHMSIN